MIDCIAQVCDSFEQVPRRLVLDIDDTEDAVHGGQQLSLFNAHYDSHCFLPIHIYEATTGKPVAIASRRTSPWVSVREAKAKTSAAA